MLGLYDLRLKEEKILYCVVEIMIEDCDLLNIDPEERQRFYVKMFDTRRLRFVVRYPSLAFHLDTQRFLTLCYIERAMFFTEQDLIQHPLFSKGILVFVLSNLPDELDDRLAEEVQQFLGLRQPIYHHKLILEYLCGINT